MDKREAFIRRVNEKDALNALLLYRQQRISENQLCTICWPYLSRISAETVWRFWYGAVDHDDLKSELWLLFVGKIVAEYRESSGPLTPYVMKYAYNLGRDIVKETKNIDYLDNEELLDVYGDQSIVQIDDAQIDRKNALDQIHVILAKNGILDYSANMNKDESFVPGFALPKTDQVSTLSVPKRRNKSELSESSKDIHKELRNIRIQLGYSQAMMAECLGIGVPRYASYEYGRTSGVPERIMKAAQAELQLDGEEISHLKKRFDIPMNDILNRWITMVGDGCDYKKLSAICGVSLSTIHRWHENQTRPSLASLNRYESLVIEWVSVTNPKIKNAPD